MINLTFLKFIIKHKFTFLSVVVASTATVAMACCSPSRAPLVIPLATPPSSQDGEITFTTQKDAQRTVVLLNNTNTISTNNGPETLTTITGLIADHIRNLGPLDHINLSPNIGAGNSESVNGSQIAEGLIALQAQLGKARMARKVIFTGTTPALSQADAQILADRLNNAVQISTQAEPIVPECVPGMTYQAGMLGCVGEPLVPVCKTGMIYDKLHYHACIPDKSSGNGR